MGRVGGGGEGLPVVSTYCTLGAQKNSRIIALLKQREETCIKQTFQVQKPVHTHIQKHMHSYILLLRPCNTSTRHY